MFGRKTEPEILIVEEPEPAPRLTFGQPCLCPLCGGYSRLDRIDLRHATQYQTCVDCGHYYGVSKDDIESAKKS